MTVVNAFDDQIKAPSSLDDVGQIQGLGRKGSKKMVLITFVVDNSTSMDGAPINALNNALLSTLQDLENIEQTSSYAEADFKVAIMTFTNSAQWIMEPCSVQQALGKLPKITVSPGNTYYSSVFKELNSALTKARFMGQGGKIARPIIIFMTDGAPHPVDKFEYDLEKLQTNGWYINAYKSAVLMGAAAEDPRAQEVCRQFVGPEGGVLSATRISEIMDKISTQTIRTLEGMPVNEDMPVIEDKNKGTIPSPVPAPIPGPAPVPTPGAEWETTSNPVPGPAPVPTPGPEWEVTSNPAQAPAPGPFGSGINSTPTIAPSGTFPDMLDDLRINPGPDPFG